MSAASPASTTTSVRRGRRRSRGRATMTTGNLYLDAGDAGRSNKPAPTSMVMPKRLQRDDGVALDAIWRFQTVTSRRFYSMGRARSDYEFATCCRAVICRRSPSNPGADYALDVMRVGALCQGVAPAEMSLRRRADFEHAQRQGWRAPPALQAGAPSAPRRTAQYRARRRPPACNYLRRENSLRRMSGRRGRPRMAYSQPPQGLYLTMTQAAGGASASAPKL